MLTHTLTRMLTLTPTHAQAPARAMAAPLERPRQGGQRDAPRVLDQPGLRGGPERKDGAGLQAPGGIDTTQPLSHTLSLSLSHTHSLSYSY